MGVWEFVQRADFIFIVAPPLIYWITALYFHALEWLAPDWIAKYRVQPKGYEAPNRVTMKRVVLQVMAQQLIQALTSLVPMIFGIGPSSEEASDSLDTPLTRRAIRILIGALTFDTWQYWIHRLMHVNRFLYTHVHSWHHRLLRPYAFGALYNHPVEAQAFLLDTMAGAVSMIVAGMTYWEGTLLFSFGMIKTVDDHCGYDLPWDPIPKIFTNNAKYHDVHHQIKGIKYNFSQPFFSFWDTICGTRWDTATKGSVYSVSVYKANEVCDDGAPVFKQD